MVTYNCLTLDTFRNFLKNEVNIEKYYQILGWIYDECLNKVSGSENQMFVWGNKSIHVSLNIMNHKPITVSVSFDTLF